jgi:hypothetical protein
VFKLKLEELRADLLKKGALGRTVAYLGDDRPRLDARAQVERRGGPKSTVVQPEGSTGPRRNHRLSRRRRD